MRKLFNIIQSKTEKVSCFATRLGTEVADIRKDHPPPSKMTKASAEDHQRDRFYQGLKKSVSDCLRYLYDTGASCDQILKAARRAEAEADNFKEVEIARAAHDDSKVLDELAPLKAGVKKVLKQISDYDLIQNYH